MANKPMKISEVGSRTDANEDGCQFDRDGCHRDMGLFWHARNSLTSHSNSNRVDAKRFRSKTQNLELNIQEVS